MNDEPSIRLSVVVPAYNEALRLPDMLNEAIDYLKTAYKAGEYEIIVVDDGSKDDTVKVALKVAEESKGTGGGESIRVVKLAKNRGKGGAVRHGVLHARGERILFVDADGASRFADLKLLEDEMDKVIQSKKASSRENGHSGQPRAIVLGSRAHMVTSPAVVKRSFLRNFLMRSFHIYLSILGISSIKDTQCGFKLFTRSAAKAIFPSLHVQGWIFDIEILLIASLLGDVEMREVPITWREVVGSKMDLVMDSLRMATDLLVIRGSYATGRWKVKR